MKAYAVLWDNVMEVVKTRIEAVDLSDSSNDEEARRNCPNLGYARVDITLAVN